MVNPSNVQSSKPVLDAVLAVRQKSSKGTHFISFPDLHEALPRSTIKREVEYFCSQQHQIPSIVDLIHRNGLRVFAILVLLRQEELILDFIESLDDQVDNKLPFEQAQISRVSSRVSTGFCSEVQWELIPHLFHSGGFHRKILNDVILPYIQEGRLDEGSGGEIYKCDIAGGQHRLSPRQVNLDTTPHKPPQSAHLHTSSYRINHSQ